MPYKDKEKDRKWHRENARKRTQLARQAKVLLGIPLDRRVKPKQTAENPK